MCDVRSAVGRLKARANILQLVLLSAGNGCDTHRREMPVVREGNIHNRGDSAQLLQPGMRGSGPICAAWIS